MKRVYITLQQLAFIN